MIRVLVLTVILVSTTSAAFALSCARPDAVRLYERARDAEETYFFVRGRIDLTGPIREPTPGSSSGNSVPAFTEARFNGVALNTHSFGTVFIRDITIEAHCIASWCGSAEGLTGEMFAALEIRDDDLVLRVGPCGGDLAQWDRGVERRVLECHRSGMCAATR